MVTESLGTIKTGTGLGSGLDIEGIVSKLVEVEGKFKAGRLDSEESETLARITGYGNLKSALSSFESSLKTLKDPDKFKVKTTSVVNDTTVSADTTYFTASASTNAIQSSYDVEVRQLAQAHKLASDVYATDSFVLGAGTLQITVGEGQSNSTTYDITVGTTDVTLSGVRDAINARNLSTGVSASILTTDAGSRLIITADNPGVKNTLGIAVSGDSDGNDTDNIGLSRLITANLTEFTAAQDAIIRLDQVATDITISSNTAVDVIQGVTLNLEKAETDKVHKLNINIDTSATKTQVSNFVTSYNNFIDITTELTKFNPLDRSENGDLFGDATVRNIESALSNGLLKTVVQPVYSSMASIGVTTNAVTGKLEINDTTLTTAISTSVEKISNLFGNEDTGIAVNLFDTVEAYTKSGGLISLQDVKLRQDLDEIADERIKLDDKLSNLEIDLTRKFSALDALLGQLQATSDRLTRELATNQVEPMSFRK